MKKNQEFKVCVILDSNLVSKSVFELIEWLKKLPNLKINYILITSNSDACYAKLSFLQKFIRILSHFSWGIIQYIEAIYYKRQHYDNSEYYINFEHDDDIVDLRVASYPQIENSFSNSSMLEELKIDLMVALAPNKYFSYLKKFSRFGLIAFDHFDYGDRLYQPIGFNEVLKKNGKTGFSILRLKESIDGIQLLFQGAFPTHNYFLANHLNILKRRNYYLKEYIFSILEKTLREANIEIISSNNIEKIEIPPDLLQQSFYILQLIKQRFFSIKNKILKKERFWKVGFIYSDWPNFRNNKIHTIENSTNCYLADPFVINVDNKDYCLAEEYSYDKCKGVIVAYELQGKNSKKIGTIIEESFHMSFPYLFKFQDKIYMIPETSENSDIRIYESIEFPHKWKLNQVLMEDVFAVDSMIFNLHNRWWLFSNINPERGSDACSELCIFSSDNPLSGKWEPHQLNPVIVNSDNARNGGILHKNNKVYRVSQKQNFGRYGAEFAINEIVTLTKDEYIERKTFHVKPDFIKNGLATHHCHSNNEITVLDFLT